MNHEKKDYQAAVLMHECLRAHTDCFGNDGKIVKTAYIVCIDDDPDSAIYAVRLAKQHFAAYGFFPKMLCVGNKGLLSRWTHKTTEGAHLKNVCVKTGFPEGMAVVLDKGRNSGENILEIRAFFDKRRRFGQTYPLLLHQTSVAPSATDAAKTGAGNQRPLVCHRRIA